MELLKLKDANGKYLKWQIIKIYWGSCMHRCSTNCILDLPENFQYDIKQKNEEKKFRFKIIMQVFLKISSSIED